MSGFEFPEPDTSMTFEFAYTDENGIPQAERMELTGENAEHLPYIMKQFNKFLAQAGFDIDLQVVGDVTKRIGPAVKALLEEDAKICAVTLLLVGALDICQPPIGMIGQGFPSQKVSKPLVTKPQVAKGREPPPIVTPLEARFPGIKITLAA